MPDHSFDSFEGGGRMWLTKLRGTRPAANMCESACPDAANGMAELDRRGILRNYGAFYNRPLARGYYAARIPVEARAEGVRVYGEDGTGYLDFAAGFGVHGLGHAHSAVRAALRRQLRDVATVPAVLYHSPAAELMRALGELAPGDLTRVALAGSGAEAVEIALRMVAAARPHRTRVVAAEKAYHGKTLGALGVLGQPHLREPFEPVRPSTRFVPYGDAGAMRAAVQDGALAVVIEPVLGGGYIEVPPAGYLTEVADLCAATGTLLIVDEVQTGFGRTGHMFAVDGEGVVPDILLVSKGMTGGQVPVAAAIFTDALAEEISYSFEADPFAFTSQTERSPAVCAAAVAAVEAISAADLPGRAARLGPRLLDGLRECARAHPKLAVDARGRGLMTGLRMRNPLAENALWLQMLKRGVITGLSTSWQARHPALRFFPPLTVEDSDIDLALDALRDALAELDRRPAFLYELADRAFKAQHYAPRDLIRYGSLLFCGGRPGSASRI